ncbi:MULTISPECIES: DMT family transporter [Oceanotoga]|jgi:drug/metabolite transporter (DMT)-like permease|uniref:Drug/metabolite transporter (DMT)-like permease n=1 Tax=Oceanotoga teriensis TaxID=515440 RepID=A0AA45C5Y2_9BACT|nr:MULTISPECIES: DMT family transporter [Oceanotoga]MDN5341501.1 hypothetical protein [Oceanotoga sp.]MDO7977706.1 DMT family transporter [Oceanotoga teriensis]PWJ90042.1 drug/metabolite transporter (DMT)-like permease [Oceanotoga teriensis]
MNNNKILTNKYMVIFLAFICCILWGSAFPVLKISYSEMNLNSNDIWEKVVFAGIRFLGSSIILFTYLIFNKKGINNLKIKDRNILFELFLLGLLQTTIQYFFFYNGLANTSGMKGAILQSSSTFITVILAHFIYNNDKINFNKIIGLLTGILGIIFSNWGKDFSFDFNFFGEGFLIFAGIISSFGTFLAKRLSKNIHPFLVSAWQMFMGSILMIIIGVFHMKKPLEFTTLSLTLLIYSSFLSAIAFGLWYSLLKYNKAGEVSIYRFMIPVSGSILSVLFIPDEKFSIQILFALFMVAIGIFAVNYKKK